jgi:hypothetical protein
MAWTISLATFTFPSSEFLLPIMRMRWIYTSMRLLNQNFSCSRIIKLLIFIFASNLRNWNTCNLKTKEINTTSINVKQQMLITQLILKNSSRFWMKLFERERISIFTWISSSKCQDYRRISTSTNVLGRSLLIISKNWFICQIRIIRISLTIIVTYF